MLKQDQWQEVLSLITSRNVGIGLPQNRGKRNKARIDELELARWRSLGGEFYSGLSVRNSTGMLPGMSDVRNNLINSHAVFYLGKDVRTIPAHDLGVALHYF